jgi:hypothetical protein
MANLLQSSQTQATSAPDFYTKYLSDIASTGASQAGISPTTGQFDPTLGAQFVGPTDLQNTAFKNVETAASAYEPTLANAGTSLTNAGAMASPLSSATNYLTSAQTDPSKTASAYMSPYMKSVIDSLSDVGQRNIQQNIAPSATAAAVGSGQYGSQRGAQVLGQTTANAERDLASQIAQTLNTGYNTALQTAEQQNALAGQLGSTAASAESAGQQNLANIGAQQSTLAGQNQALSLADINALSTLGGQQQTIKQNQQLFPLTNLATLSGLLRGYNVPTTTTTTAQGSPLSGIASLGALSQTPAASNLASNIKNLFSGLTTATPSNASFVGTNSAGTNLYWDSSANGGVGGYVDSTGKSVSLEEDK